ncbi:nucleoside deaminase [Candidatus Aquarickettsia rohweri]|nr:nucleoside deaminase [Candidatus Aquarickettsia rohweri]MSO13435.1 tRNA-specific adenosine deaminase [Rickettsiales endosymbiont of Trichoplax sp. H2]
MKLKTIANLNFNQFMNHALSQAEIAFKNNEVPVGSILTHNNKIISSNYNKVKSNVDPTAHAEILCIRETAKKLKITNLSDCELYTTLEPCAMCAQAIAFSKIKCLYFGAYDKKFGAIENGVRLFHSKTHNHTPEIYGGIMEQKAVDLMQKFFIRARQK